MDFGLAHKVPEKRESKLAKRIAESKAKSDRKPLSTSKQHQDVINQKVRSVCLSNYKLSNSTFNHVN